MYLSAVLAVLRQIRFEKKDDRPPHVDVVLCGLCVPCDGQTGRLTTKQRSAREENDDKRPRGRERGCKAAGHSGSPILLILTLAS